MYIIYILYYIVDLRVNRQPHLLISHPETDNDAMFSEPKRRKETLNLAKNKLTDISCINAMKAPMGIHL